MDFKKYFSLLNKNQEQPLPVGIASPEELDGTINDGGMLLGMDMNPPTREPAAIPSPAPSVPVSVPAELPTISAKPETTPSSLMPSSPASETPAQPDYMNLLASAQNNQNNNTLVNNMLKAGQTIGSALAYNKPDYTVANSLQESAGQDVNNVLQQMKSRKDQTALNDDKNLRDPNSNASKNFRKAMARLGVSLPETTSAWDLKTLGYNPQNIMMQDRAIDKQMKLLEHKQRKETDSFVTGAQKTLLKPYQEYQKAAKGYNAMQELDKLATDPNGAKDIQTLYNFISTLDPASTVREGEIALTREGMSALEKAGIKARSLTTGQILSPQFRSAIKDVMKQQAEQARGRYEELAQPFRLHGASRGLDETDYGKFDYLAAADAKKTAGQPSTQVPAPHLVERKTKDGRTALFDPTTKQFVKYKE